MVENLDSRLAEQTAAKLVGKSVVQMADKMVL